MYLTMDLRLIFYNLRDEERKHSKLTVTQINNTKSKLTLTSQTIVRRKHSRLTSTPSSKYKISRGMKTLPNMYTAPNLVCMLRHMWE